ncbi:hypothetical protein WOLCODRAFT_157926 [Wolfiporia cocos MD-104 SS10]|uniref:Uncharacterized protein n=1 Tax=Wolfiporia cocos (strain MD-104) TaxID=742152 RepID=A0A2H3J4Q2_WOLCO|nr:hypothetical protein WOLCODRAFT_157926 [Wolfiporia cocos MD-104 SS10]
MQKLLKFKLDDPKFLVFPLILFVQNHQTQAKSSYMFFNDEIAKTPNITISSSAQGTLQAELSAALSANGSEQAYKGQMETNVRSSSSPQANFELVLPKFRSLNLNLNLD